MPFVLQQRRFRSMIVLCVAIFSTATGGDDSLYTLVQVIFAGAISFPDQARASVAVLLVANLSN